MRTTSSSGRVAAALVGVGALAFAVPHVLWALGSRWTVPAAAPPISQRPVFLAYDLVALAALLGLAAGCAVLALRSRPPRPRLARRVVLVAAVLAGLRGAIGLTQIAVLALRGEPVGVTAVFDLWFALTALALVVVLRGLPAQPSSRRASARWNATE